MKIQLPRGTHDILPIESSKWQFLEKNFQEICEKYQYEEVRTPVFEHTELFQRGIGESTDIISKEMYTFLDKGNRSITLRPEGTAPIVRAFVEHKLYGDVNQPVKLFYKGPMFRYERPQNGRQREFNQMGIEALGSSDPAIDVEIISLAMHFLEKIGLKKISLIINSLGDKGSRLKHREALIAHFAPHINEFCEDCNKRLYQNPLRILDCKKDHEHPLIQSAPPILDYLNEESIHYFTAVKNYLKAVDIDYTIDATLVRGLDYYNHTTFEIINHAEGPGTQATLCGGGRYHGLVEEIGGPETKGVGFGMGVERILLALEYENIQIPPQEPLDCYIITAQKEALAIAVRFVHKLRQAGISAEKDYMNRKMKAQLKDANRKNARYILIIGEEEMKTSKFQLKNMETGEQNTLTIKEIETFLQR